MNTLNWGTININSIFDISYGNKLDMCQMTEKMNGIPFVTRSAENNGIGGYVEQLEDVAPYNSGCLTVALGGSIGSTFLQNEAFYTSQNVAVLSPKEKLTDEILLFLATIIEKECNKRFVAFGRELNKHIKRDFTIKLPLNTDNCPDWKSIESYIKDILVPKLPKGVYHVWEQTYNITPYMPNDITLSNKSWDWFSLSDPRLFTIKKGKRLTKADMIEGDIRYIGAIESNNGVSEHISNDEHIHPANTITVSYNGSVAEAFYQNEMFWATDDVNVLYPNFQLNKYIALFITTIIKREKYRFNYGRKWDKELMQKSLIKLPVDSKGNPDWQFMEDYIKSLPYSKNI